MAPDSFVCVFQTSLATIFSKTKTSFIDVLSCTCIFVVHTGNGLFQGT